MFGSPLTGEPWIKGLTFSVKWGESLLLTGPALSLSRRGVIGVRGKILPNTFPIFQESTILAKQVFKNGQYR